MRQSYIVAIDALNLRRSAKGINMQYTQEGVQRELTKAWAGGLFCCIAGAAQRECGTGLGRGVVVYDAMAL